MKLGKLDANVITPISGVIMLESNRSDGRSVGNVVTTNGAVSSFVGECVATGL